MNTEITARNAGVTLPVDSAGLTPPLRTLRGSLASGMSTLRHVRPIRVDGDLAYVPLTQGFTAIVDVADAHLLDGMNWRVHRNQGGTYAKTQVRGDDGQRRVLMMHTLLTGFPMTDHMDGNGLNNRRSNLRAATWAENNRNSRMQKNNRSGFKGVSRTKYGRWIARIAINGRQISLGNFDSPEDAHRAYCKASIRFHGEFGRQS